MLNEIENEKKINKWAWLSGGIGIGMVIAFIIDSLLYYLLAPTC